MSQDEIVVIGAGVGGLACAIDLARQGRDVTVIERSPRAGGKLREVRVGDTSIDSGPTVLTMRWVFDALFEAAGAGLDDHLGLRPADILARHAWSESERLDLFADPDRSADAIGRFAGAAEAAGYRSFRAESAAIYQTLRDSYLTAQQTGPLGLAWRVGLGRARALAGIHPFETLWSALGAHFADPRLRQLFGRYATYCGSSPFLAPATLMLIAHVEQEGVWLVDGGMRRLAGAMEALCRSLGVRFRFGEAAVEIIVEHNRARGVVLAGGERLGATAVVLNADPEALAAGAFGALAGGAVPRRRVSQRSLSALTWSMIARTADFLLTRHNVFFSRDYSAEFDDIQRAGRLPGGPTVYVCAQDRDDGPSPQGLERLLVLINAPANADRRRPCEAEVAACERGVFDHLAACGLTIAPEGRLSRVTTPADFNSLYPGAGGALYGSATHGWAAAFHRPGAATRVAGLYLAGGGVHPGPGLPMAALSGRLAARRLMADRDSTRPSLRGATPGGISTP